MILADPNTDVLISAHSGGGEFAPVEPAGEPLLHHLGDPTGSPPSPQGSPHAAPR